MGQHPGYFWLYVIAAVCFALAALNVGVKVGRVINLIGLGLLAAVLVPLLEMANS